MSCMIKVKVQFSDRDAFAKSLGIVLPNAKVQVGDNLIVKGFGGRKSRAEIVIPVQYLSGFLADIGFRRTGDCYELICDEMDLRKARYLLEKAKAVYAEIMVTEESQKAGFKIANREVMADKTVRITLEQWR